MKTAGHIDLNWVGSENKAAEEEVSGAPLPTDPFKLAERAEIAIGAIYTLLSRSFRDEPKLRALFGLLASEEEAHARRVREVERLWHDKDVSSPPTLDTKRLGRLITHAQILHQKLSRVDEVDENTAFELAASMEHDFADVHAEALAQTQDPLLVKLFTELANGDRGHAVLLSRAKKAE
ncbi:MAG: hypothetical protein JRH20_27245 [Deltaproteobacteria bacterium]|nr:hypothetical protein [Deltaproteobacteria bacterium]